MGVGSLSHHSFVGVAVHLLLVKLHLVEHQSAHHMMALPFIASLNKNSRHTFGVYARIRASNTFIRASSSVLSMWPCTLKSDEQKSKYAGLAQENSFALANVLSLLRLLKGAAR